MQPDDPEFQNTPVIAGALRCISAILAARAIDAFPRAIGGEDWSRWFPTMGVAILAVCVWFSANGIATLLTGRKLGADVLDSRTRKQWEKYVGACLGLCIFWRSFVPDLINYASNFNTDSYDPETNTVTSVVRVESIDIAKLLAYVVLIAVLLLGKDYIAARFPKIEFVGGPQDSDQPNSKSQR